jgi:phosphate starvation-inducible PhoH-like protein
VVTGDVTQVDLPQGARSGLAEARDLLQGIEGIAFCHFTEVDVVRHPLVQRIIVAYDRRDAELQQRREQERRGESSPVPPAAEGTLPGKASSADLRARVHGEPPQGEGPAKAGGSVMP